MGCGNSSVIQPIHSFSLSGKYIKECNNLYGKITITEQGVVPIYYARDSALINSLNKEIAFRIKEAATFPKNQESEFIDLRSEQEFNKSHLYLFMNMDANREQALSSSDSTLKVLFDFKHIYFLADDNDIKNYESVSSMIQFGSTSLDDQSLQVPSQQNIRIATRVKSVIKLFNSKNVKAKSYNIIRSEYSKIESNYQNYIVKSKEQQQKLPQNQQQQSNLVGENEVFINSIFREIQIPLFIYDHNDFILSNEKGVKISTNKGCQIYLQSLAHFQSNLNVNEGKKFYLDCLKIQTICITSQTATIQEITQLSSQLQSIPVKQYLLKDSKENKISMMKQLHSHVESGMTILIIRDNTKESFLDVIQVFKGLLFEKYCIYSTQIQDYLTISVPKNIAYQMQQSTSMIDNLGGGKTIQQIEDTKLDKQDMNRCQQFSELITPIFKENKKKKDKQDAFTDIFAQLFENIIRNPNEEKFRIIKKSNKKIKEAILNYKQSPQILILCGFIDKGEVYENQLTPADITLIKGDFNLAVKNALKEIYNQ